MAGHGIDGFDVLKLSADAVCGRASRAPVAVGGAGAGDGDGDGDGAMETFLGSRPVFVKVYPRRPDKTLKLLALLLPKLPDITPPVIDGGRPCGSMALGGWRDAG